MKKTWKKLSSRIVHKNTWYHVRQDRVIKPDGSRGLYHVVVSPDAVFIVALNDADEVCLIEQYRHPTNHFSIEIPAGGSEYKKPLTAAKRELQEEAGLIARQWKLLGKLDTATGLLSEKSYIFLATKLSPAESHKQGEEGIQRVTMVPLRKALKMVKEGKITDGQTASSLLLAAIERGLLRRG